MNTHTVDPTKPLAPLDPADTSALGVPKTWPIPRAGGLDYEISGWKIGEGHKGVGSDDPASWRKGTTVEIWLTPKGRLITAVIASTRPGALTGEVDDFATDSMRSKIHETPAAALAWLIDDGKGKLGAASKAAWVKACRTFAPMKGMDVERVE